MKSESLPPTVSSVLPHTFLIPPLNHEEATGWDFLQANQPKFLEALYAQGDFKSDKEAFEKQLEEETGEGMNIEVIAALDFLNEQGYKGTYQAVAIQEEKTETGKQIKDLMSDTLLKLPLEKLTSIDSPLRTKDSGLSEKEATDVSVMLKQQIGRAHV